MLDQRTPDGDIGAAKIKVVGVGGGGSNAVSRMYRDRIPEVDYIIVNTDAQALSRSEMPVVVRVGDQTARGLGVGGDPERGRQCMEEDRDQIREMLEGADLVFVAAGMGGGSGTGGAPVIAEVARETGALTVGVITKPFKFEGNRRMKQAEEGIARLTEVSDTLIVVPNERLRTTGSEPITMDTAFRMADDVLRQGVQSIAELILVPGEINLDFADVRSVMKSAGPAWMAIGYGQGEDRAVQAAEAALSSPMLEVSIEGATGVIFNISGGRDLTLEEVNTASEIISGKVDPEANIIFGMVTDPQIQNEVTITVIATGFPAEETAKVLKLNGPSMVGTVSKPADIDTLAGFEDDDSSDEEEMAQPVTPAPAAEVGSADDAEDSDKSDDEPVPLDMDDAVDEDVDLPPFLQRHKDSA